MRSPISSGMIANQLFFQHLSMCIKLIDCKITSQQFVSNIINSRVDN
uniref:Uncharacterized protein n=1 Tax=Arundo donax TaxID=35708 RepID=A0A0A9E073_ARUDO